MNIATVICRRWLLPALLLLPLVALAGQTTSGAYTIHYNALSASALPQAMATRLGVEATANQGVVNVTVLKNTAGDASSASAEVSGSAATLTGTRIPIRFQRISDDSGESWIGSFRIPGNEALRFKLEVTPPDGIPVQIEFVQDFTIR